MGALEGKVAVVTGSTEGIGRAVALRYAAEGAKVVVNARREEKVRAYVEELRGLGHDAFGCAGDVADRAQLEAVAAKVLAEYGRIDIWVNNAGTTVVGDSLTLDVEDFRHVIDVNLVAVFSASQVAARQMRAQGGGVIIQMGSIFGEVAMGRRAPYISSKHALVGLTKLLASEWAQYGIRVVCVEPGYIRTAFTAADPVTGDDYTEADIERRTPMHRFGTVEEVAGLMAFVASDESSYLTGAAIPLDGGWTAYGGW